MNTEKFTGKAEAYAKARPGYPGAAIEYLCGLVPQDAVFADIGAGTGKFTELLAQKGYNLFAVEPNADMREQLAVTLKPYPNAIVVNGSAEVTMLDDQSIDVITCAQALHWFDPDGFRAECRRIGKPNAIVMAIYNVTPGGSSVLHSKQAPAAFFVNPTMREFSNPILYTREQWIAYRMSHALDPLPSASGYAAHITEVNEQFDRESMDGFLQRDIVTKLFHADI